MPKISKKIIESTAHSELVILLIAHVFSFPSFFDALLAKPTRRKNKTKEQQETKNISYISNLLIYLLELFLLLRKTKRTTMDKTPFTKVPPKIP